MITAIIDLAESKVTGRSCINTGVSIKLDALRRDYDGLSTMLVHVARDLVARVPEWARPHIDACIFYPQLGFLTVVFLNPETGKGKYEGEGLVEELWESMFVDGDKVYYKNATMRELDQAKGNLYVAIQGQSYQSIRTGKRSVCSHRACLDEEIEIAQILALKILILEDALIAANDTCGELDSFLALATSAEMYKWTAPCMENENVIQIEGGRHALQELAVSSFIDNDCRLAGGPGPDTSYSSEWDAESVELDPSMLVLTGPNHSGKSVYLKQVALIVFLAHIGSYVPARRAIIGFTDRLLTRVSTRESISCEGSAFAIDLRQAAFAINFATRRSLIIVDEFGKGTNSFDGAGLCTGLLDHFLGLGREAPKVLVASHFHEVFENGFLNDMPGLDRLAFAHMDVRLDEDAANPEDEVVYLFRLVPGRSTSSLGSHCAAMNGVQSVVVERAEALMVLLSKGEDIEAACTKLTPEEEEDLEKAETTARHLLAWSSGGIEKQTSDESEEQPSGTSANFIRDELQQILLLDADQVARPAEDDSEDIS
jgi:DNA mismatch repair protein MSH5